jgi:hypothetical protein
LSEDNPLFNRVEMVNQANFTIERLTEEGLALKKTLESLGGSLEKIKAAQKAAGASYEAPVFHQGVGPLASHEVPPIVPDMEPTEEVKRKKKRSATSISTTAESPIARPRNNSSVLSARGPHALPPGGLMPSMGGLFGATGNPHQNAHLQRQQQELMWMHQHQQMQLEGQRRMLMGHRINHQQQPTSSIGELQAYLANQHVHAADPSRTGLPNGIASQMGGHPAGFSAQAYELAMVSRMLGRQQHPTAPLQQQPQASALDPESQYHRTVSNFQPMTVQSQHQLSGRGLGAPVSFHVGDPSGGGERTTEADRAYSDDTSAAGSDTGG